MDQDKTTSTWPTSISELDSHITDISTQIKNCTLTNYSAMHDIVRTIEQVEAAATLEETAAAMINMLVFVCTHCTAQHFTPIYTSWNKLVMATFNYLHIIIQNTNDEEDNDSEGEIYETWTHEHINDHEETTIAETAWLMEAHNTFAPLKELLNNNVCERNKDSLRPRLNDMREADRCVLLALTHKNYNAIIANMLSTDSEEVKTLSITTNLTRAESGESSLAIATMCSGTDISEMQNNSKDNHQNTVVSTINNYVANSYWTALRKNYTISQKTRDSLPVYCLYGSDNETTTMAIDS